MTKSAFINPDSWSDINRGYFYQAAMYYLSDTEQPLRFVEENVDGSFSIKKRHGDFNPIEVNGRHRAVEQDIVVTVKPRQVIVMSDNRINQSSSFEYIQILPIFGLKYVDSIKPWYQDMKSDNHAGLAYIQKGEYGIAVDLTQLSTIHKSLLLRKQHRVPTGRIEFIESQLVELLDL